MIRSKFNTIMILILASMFLFGFADSIDTSQPAGSDDPSEADDNMRRIQAAFQQRLDVDHVFALSGTTVDAANTGEHKKITFNTTIDDPTQVAGNAHLYMQFDELRYQDDTNAAFDITSVGKLGSATTDLTVNNATMAGTLEATGLTTVADGSLTKTTAAPTTDAMIANKKYVDDTVKLTAESNTDSTGDVMLKNHAYLAQSDGIVRAQFISAAINNGLTGFVHTAADAKESGKKIATWVAHAGSESAGINFVVKNGEYFEVASTPTATIQWTSFGTQAKPIDQD